MKNVILLDKEQTLALTKAQNILENILDMEDKLSNIMDENDTIEVESYDGMPYVNGNIEKAWRALYKLNFETSEEYEDEVVG